MYVPSQFARQPAPRRGGAVIILSLALLMTLLFLGLFFFAFIDDESLSADMYARQFTAEGLVDERTVLDWGLDQVIVQTNSSEYFRPRYAPFSVLGDSTNQQSRFSLLAHIIGRINDDGSLADYEPYNGAGGRVLLNDNPGTASVIEFGVDVNGDGTLVAADGDVLDLADLRLNGSPLADGATPIPVTRFDADAGYTYPDLNSLFMYHELVDPVTGAITAIKPSFDLPGVMYAAGDFGVLSATNSLSKERVLRPHTQHVYADGTERYLTAMATTAQSGDTTRTFGPFNTGTTAPYQYLNDDPAQMGLWNASGTTPASYGLHVDADGDGVRDSFLIDLDYPMITFPDGRQGVPMFFWRIEDADALVNLNTAGDMPMYRMAERKSSPATRSQLINALASDPQYLTRADTGFSPSEINPGIVLGSRNSNISSVLAQASDQYGKFFTHYGAATPALDRLHIANTELMWLMTGRHDFDTTGTPKAEIYDIAGRYGETAGLVNSSPALPGPGTTGVDDDGDSNSGQTPNGGAAYTERFRTRGGTPQTNPVVMPPGVHPRNPSGYGPHLVRPGGATPSGMIPAVKDLASTTPNPQTTNPSRFLEYRDLTAAGGFSASGANLSVWQHPVGTSAGVTPYVNAIQNRYLQGDTLTGDQRDMLLDDPDELVVDRTDSRFANRDDAPFSPAEMGALHISDVDWGALGLPSRLRELAPINFELSDLAQAIRRSFTTESWDRPEFGLTRNNSTTFRNWEISDAVDDAVSRITSDQEFPPQFGAVPAVPPNYTQRNVTNYDTDPLRPELRRLLYVNFEDDPNDVAGNSHPQHRLQLNGILSDDSLGRAGGASCFDSAGNPRFRPLVPHPVFDATADASIAPWTPPAMVHAHGGQLPFQFSAIGTGSPAGKQAQEWWARYDRQRLARDIYTMLWMLGSPPTVNPMTMNYTPAQSAEMAQFAVNVVDAMDHDHVITKFEYDDNLTDGWGGSPTGVAYGLEAQDLTLSETLWIQAPRVTSGMTGFDHPATYYDDGLGEHHFLFVELRNAQPFDAKLAADTYQVERYEAGASVATLTFDGSLASPLNVPGGGNYVVASHNDPAFVEPTTPAEPLSSDFRLDYAADATTVSMTYRAVAPAWSEATPPTGDVTVSRDAGPAPLVDFDLCHDRERTTGQKFEEYGNAVGYFLPPCNPMSTFSATGNEIVLKRRMNMQGDGVLADASNDWIEIDRMTVYPQTFTLNDTSTAADVQTEFRNLRSRERLEPLYAHSNGEGGINCNTSNGFYKHSLGSPDSTDGNTDPTLQTLRNYGVAAELALGRHQPNAVLETAGGTAFQLWQPHFDRGFTSVMDLLSVQLLGPSQLIYHDRTTPAEGGFADAGINRMTGIHAAALRFLNPQMALPAYLLPPNIDADLQAEHFENRWFRLFEFLSVPTHTSDGVADSMTLRRRIPGRLNINTMRGETLLAAAINDNDQLWMMNPASPDSTANRPTADRFAAAPGRNWYDEMRRTRDGYSAATMSIRPPGTPYATPFRPLSFDDPLATDPLQNSILRRHDATSGYIAGSGGAASNIGLFEARNPADLNTDEVDFHTRQRILSRIANLTTNRSHVFVIFGGFQLHEAHEINEDANNNGVLDMGEDRNGNGALDGLVQIGAQMTDLLPYREFVVVDMSRLEEAYDPTAGRFNFESFILHREVLP